MENESGTIWQDIIRAKYLKNHSISNVKHRINDSPVWCDLLKVKQFYLCGRKLKVNNGANTLFWTDPWLEEKPLCSLYSVIFELANEKAISVNDFIRKRGKFPSGDGYLMHCFPNGKS